MVLHDMLPFVLACINTSMDADGVKFGIKILNESSLFKYVFNFALRIKFFEM